MLESGLSRLLESRHIFGEPSSDSLSCSIPEIYNKLWSQLQMRLKRMLTVARAGSMNKFSVSQAAPMNSMSGDIGKLKELYRMSLKSTDMLESALSRLLEGHHIFGEPGSDSLSSSMPEVYNKLWSQLQILLKRMLTVARAGSTNKSSVSHASPTNSRSGDIGKLKELYRMSLKSTDASQLCAMYDLWMS